MERVELKNTYGYRDFITLKEQEELVYFINSNLSYFMNNVNKEHYVATIEKIPNYPKELIDNLRKKIVELEGIVKYYPDLMYEDAVSILYKNGHHGYHRDMNYGDWVLTRYNIMLSVPDDGGLSLYGKELNYIEERMVWKCVAGMVSHGVTKVMSDKPRICLCLGFMIHQLELRKNTQFSQIENYVLLPPEYEYMFSLLKWNSYH